jgi:hypothetical protein
MTVPSSTLNAAKRGRAVAFVIVGHGATAAGLDRQARLGAVERLDLALLVDRQHHGMGRRIDVQPDDVLDLGGEFGVGRELEAAHLMGPQPVGPPDPLHRADAEPAGHGHRRRRPVGHVVRRWLFQRSPHHPLDHGLGQGRDACRPGLVVQQTVHAVGHEPLLPAPDAGLRHPGPAHDRDGAAAVPRRQDDPRPPDVFLRAVPVRHDRLEPSTISGTHVDLDALAHGHSLPSPWPQGNLSLDLIH